VRLVIGTFCLLLLIHILPTAAVAAGPSSEACLGCHSDPTLTAERHGRTISLHVDAAAFGRSAHKDLACADCHSGLSPDDLPHAVRIPPVDCAGCHGDLTGSHGFHAFPARDGAGPALLAGVSCSSCHGTHDIRPPGSESSPLRREGLLETCGRCHAGVVARFKASAHGRALAGGGPGAPDCLTCHRTAVTSKQMPQDGAALKQAQEKICLSCHLANPEVRARMAPTTGFIAAYEQSVHGKALHVGDASAANCVDCHGSHEMEHGFDAAARVSKQRIPATCGACHSEIAETYRASAHGQALARGNHDAPVCTNCHGEHSIEKAHDPRSPVAAGNVSAQVCSPCHSSVRMAQKYGLASDRFQTFSDSYHGLALRGGDLEVANCASCHGSHDIRPSSDPRSTVHKANLAHTCGRCHPGANERFAIGAVHLAAAEPDERILHWIAAAYIGLIVVTVGGMAAHNTIDFMKRSRRRLRRRTGLEDEAREPAGRGLYLRMTLSERLQHGSLLVAFVVLVVTGFMLHDPDAWWVAGLRRVHPRLFELRSLLHRAAGVALIAASLIHAGYAAFSRRGRRLILDLLPRRSDFADALGVVRYNLGLSNDKPRFGRFSYVEKSEYWALVWGTIVMGLTGLVLWFENTSMGLLTKLGWDVARTIHFYEAWLATLAIIVWHLYYVVFNPDVYPMSTAWLTGHLTEEEMLDEHPLELEAIRRRQLEDTLRREAAERAEKPGSQVVAPVPPGGPSDGSGRP
jgi:predicted CXXCH cytochrome family protein